MNYFDEVRQLRFEHKAMRETLQVIANANPTVSNALESVMTMKKNARNCLEAIKVSGTE